MLRGKSCNLLEANQYTIVRSEIQNDKMGYVLRVWNLGFIFHLRLTCKKIWEILSGMALRRLTTMKILSRSRLFSKTKLSLNKIYAASDDQSFSSVGFPMRMKYAMSAGFPK